MIEFKNITKSYQQKPVLENFSMEIPKGKTVVLVGLSGCGKTTTLKMINSLVKPTRGDIFIRGKNIKEWDPIKLRRRIGYVIQQTGLFPHMTIRQNIEIILRIEKHPQNFISKRTEELMDMVGLDMALLDRYPAELSGGQQQRVGVARAFATSPEIILMDEPFSALDPLTRSDLQDSLIDLQDKLKKTIVFVTHDMDEALRIADYICIMDQGKIVQYDSPENILREPANDFVAEFIGKNKIWSSPDLIKIEDVMIERPLSCLPTFPLDKCMEKMRVHKVDSLMVVEEANQKFLGIIRARQIQREENRRQPAKAIMRTDVLTANPQDSILDVLHKIQDKRKVNIPVVSDTGRLVGLLTKSSLITTLSQQYFDSDSEE